jgi:DNA polymerase I
MLALLDGDLILYRCAASAENDPLEIAIHRANELLDLLLVKTEATDYKFFISGDGNFRKEIYPEYKGNRTAPRPKHLLDLREWAINKANAEVSQHELETDDYLGIYQDKQEGSTIIASLDKDLLQIPGKHYRWAIATSKWSKEEEYHTITEIEGLRLFYQQCLKGDVSDNVKGVANIGEKKATKLLTDCKTEQEMLAVCLEHYPSEEEFLMNAQCLYILRSFDDSYLKRYEVYK